MKYHVGQVIYLLNEKNLKIIPCLITEELIKSSLEGKEVSYTVMLPGLKQKQIPLADTDMSKFSDLESARSFMYENAKTAINSMIDAASHFESEFFDDKKFTNDSDKIDPDDDFISEENNLVDVSQEELGEKVKVDIGNGIMANISVNDLEKIR